jgi:hypothetical protein
VQRKLIPEGFGIFPEFREKNPGIPGVWQLYMGASKNSMDVAEPLARVYRYMFQEMGAPLPLHHLTPCCTPVAPLHPCGSPSRLGPPPSTHCAAVIPPHKPMRCAACPIRARCGLWPSVHPSIRAPEVHNVTLLVTQRPSPGFPGLLARKALLHSSELHAHG